QEDEAAIAPVDAAIATVPDPQEILARAIAQTLAPPVVEPMPEVVENEPDWASQLLGAQAAESAEPQPAGPPSTSSLSILFLGAGLVVIAGWVLVKRSGGGRKLPADSQMQHLQSMRLGSKQQVSLVKVGERRLLLGVAESGITLLADLSTEQGEQDWGDFFRDVLQQSPAPYAPAGQPEAPVLPASATPVRRPAAPVAAPVNRVKLQSRAAMRYGSAQNQELDRVKARVKALRHEAN
ncbi:MAG: FliO/MopB family protein, partial [Myxococcales bacterium]|nr:FliO/MopB family protein [Myxococcales bacterium]